MRALTDRSMLMNFLDASIAQNSQKAQKTWSTAGFRENACWIAPFLYFVSTEQPRAMYSWQSACCMLDKHVSFVYRQCDLSNVAHGHTWQSGACSMAQQQLGNLQMTTCYSRHERKFTLQCRQHCRQLCPSAQGQSRSYTTFECSKSLNFGSFAYHCEILKACLRARQDYCAVSMPIILCDMTYQDEHAICKCQLMCIRLQCRCHQRENSVSALWWQQQNSNLVVPEGCC